MTITPVQSSHQIHEQLRCDPHQCLPHEVFDIVLSYVEPKDLERAERVCRAWKQFIDEPGRWKIQCQIQLGLPSGIDPKVYLPKTISCNPQEHNPMNQIPAGPVEKIMLQYMFTNILDHRVYERHIGKIGPVPMIPKELSLQNWNKPDPCDVAKTIGGEYVWMYCPSHIEIDQRGCFLDKPDDPTNPQAPKLILGPERLAENARALQKHSLTSEAIQARLGKYTVAECAAFEYAALHSSISEPDAMNTSLCESSARIAAQNTTLKVPVTIHNLLELFKCTTTRTPPICKIFDAAILQQHGDERISPEWVCMRKDVIGKGCFFAVQQAFAAKSGVVPSGLLHRILFNFLQHVRSHGMTHWLNTKVYPDGQNPWQYARTSTLTQNTGNIDCPSSCGCGGVEGLEVILESVPNNLYCVGLAVMLPSKV